MAMLLRRTLVHVRPLLRQPVRWRTSSKLSHNYQEKNPMPKDYVDKVDYDLFNAHLQDADHRFFDQSFPDEFMEEDALPLNQTEPRKSYIESEKHRLRVQSEKNRSIIENVYHQEEKKIAKANHRLFVRLCHQYLITQGMHTRMTAKGRETGFSCVMVVGDGNGTAGMGYGRGSSPQTAKKKAMMTAAKNLVYVPRHYRKSIFEDELIGTHNAAEVRLWKMPRGHGAKGCPIVYSILRAFGITDVSSRWLGRKKSKIACVYATFNAITQTVSYRQRAMARGLNYYVKYEQGTGKQHIPTKEEHKRQVQKVDRLLKETGIIVNDMNSMRNNVNLAPVKRYNRTMASVFEQEEDEREEWETKGKKSGYTTIDKMGGEDKLGPYQQMVVGFSHMGGERRPRPKALPRKELF